MFLKGAPAQVTVYTNYKNLTIFTIIKTLNKRQVRWFKELAQY
jgi:hypothetical protein